jgi:rare lipoprotein A
MKLFVKSIILFFIFWLRQTHADAQKLGDESYGIASFYANFFYNQPTSTGEILKRNGYTAAHMTLPYNTMVEVTNLRNKRFVIVRVNDRGPYKPGRIIDLTENAQKWLKIDDEGLMPVKIKIVGFDGDIMIEAFDSLTLTAQPKVPRLFYQKSLLRYKKHYRLKRHWRKRKYPHLKVRRIVVMSYQARLAREAKRKKAESKKKKK